MMHYGPAPATTLSPDRAQRRLLPAILNGLKGRCPNCAEGRLFRAFLKPVDSCSSCHEELHHQRADDLPPYLSIFIVGHIVVGGYMFGERLVDLNSWQHLGIWVPITLAMTFAMMQPIKGGVIGLQWAARMHGFGGEPDKPADDLDDEDER
ncbi:DUF983 domain-containing protein [Pararhizobium haloflavum]|uniref:DUF983 domain-containing protein n=1 Tax=Pararhizobium haloflavum TaxID=2037914 RepID=UPI000C19C11B|nr:DUF983 domain-containing protein [Pararhizobium haloflavum]